MFKYGLKSLMFFFLFLFFFFFVIILISIFVFGMKGYLQDFFILFKM